MDRIEIVDGNLKELKLGLSEATRLELIENVQIVVHAGAAVNFNSPIQDVGMINVRGTREMLNLAKEMKNLIAFAYLSTAFTHCWSKDIDEEFHGTPIDPDKMIKIVEFFEKKNDSDVLDVLGKKLIAPWPNTFTFSKAITEELVRRASKTIPIIVLRPSSGKVYKHNIIFI